MRRATMPERQRSRQRRPQAIQDLMGGRVNLMFDHLSSISPHIKAGRLKEIATGSIDQGYRRRGRSD